MEHFLLWEKDFGSVNVLNNKEQVKKCEVIGGRVQSSLCRQPNTVTVHRRPALIAVRVHDNTRSAQYTLTLC